MFRPLQKKDMYKIHSASLEVLDKTGCQILDEKCLSVFKDAGCEVDETKHLVRVPEELVHECLKRCPPNVKLFGRTPRYDVTLGAGRVCGHTAEGAVRVLDLETGKTRPAAIKDVETFARLADGLGGVDMCLSPITPQDIPCETRGIHVAKVLLENTVKPCCPGGMALGVRKYIRKMIAAVVGGYEEMRKRPIGAMPQGSVFAISPLKFPKEHLIDLRESAELSLPCGAGAMPSAGGTAPVTLAGTLVIQTAETLAGIVLGQILQPGLPMLVYVRAGIMDVRIGAFSSGAPEFALVEAAGTQLFKEYYKLPVDAGWGVSDSKVLDEQVGYEKAFIWLLSVMAGASAVSGMSMIETSLTSSPSQLVIDNEILDMVRRVAEGIIFDEERLAVDLVDEVGIGGYFMNKRQTFNHYKSEQFMARISDRYSRDMWEKKGAKNIVERAREKAKDILATHEVEPLSADVKKELNKILIEAEKDLLKKNT